MGFKLLLLAVLVFTGCNVPTGSDSDFKLGSAKLSAGSSMSTTVNPGSQIQLGTNPSASPTVSPSASPTVSITQLLSKVCTEPNSCFFAMPQLNQKDTSLGADLLPNGASGSQLCGPVSGTMVLSTYLGFRLANLPQVQVLNWTLSSFKDKTWQEQVRNMSTLMGTSPTTGTTLSGVKKGVEDRVNDFTQGMVVGSTKDKLDFAAGSSFIAKMKEGNLFEVMNGHYKGTKFAAMGFGFKTFTRNGGHLTALRGWSNGRVVINDPWGGTIRYTYLGKIFLTNDQTILISTNYQEVPSQALPYGNRDAAFFVDLQKGEDFEIIEAYSMLSMIPPQ